MCASHATSLRTAMKDLGLLCSRQSITFSTHGATALWDGRMDSEAETGNKKMGVSSSESGSSFKSQRDVFHSACEGARRPSYLEERFVCACVYLFNVPETKCSLQVGRDDSITSESHSVWPPQKVWLMFTPHTDWSFWGQTSNVSDYLHPRTRSRRFLTRAFHANSKSAADWQSSISGSSAWANGLAWACAPVCLCRALTHCYTPISSMRRATAACLPER